MSNKKAVIYCRVSTKEQAEEGNSLRTQEKICIEYALKNDYEVVRVFIEHGESAKTADRTEFNKLMAFVTTKKNEIRAVIAYKIDRISRNTLDYSQIKIKLKNYGVEIKSTSEFFEDNPAGRFMENIIANVAQFDNDVRTERCVGGMRDACREGRYVWAAPLGYSNVRVNGRATIAPNHLAPLVRKVFEKIAENYTHVEYIRQDLAKQGLLNVQGKPISSSYFYRIIRNEIYTGYIIKFGERNKGAFDPIVSEDVFNQAQRVLNYNNPKRAVYQIENPDFPLRRFVRHPNGKLLTGAWSRGKSKKYPYYLFRYPSMTLPRDTMENGFIQFFNSYSMSRELISRLMKKLETQFKMKTVGREKKKSEAGKTIQELKERQSLLVKKNLDGVLPDSVLTQELELIEKKMMESYSLCEIRRDKVDIFFFEDLLFEFLQTPGNTWQKAPSEIKRKLQVFNFPQGITFDGKIYRTPKVRNVLKLNKGKWDSESPGVDFQNTESNSSFVDPEQFWDEIVLELKTLSEILEGKDKKSEK